MKVLRSGPPWTLTVQCFDCQSLLLVEENDITLEQTPPPACEEERRALRGKPDYGQHFWKCAACGKSQQIDEVPAHVKNLARMKADWNVGQ